MEGRGWNDTPQVLSENPTGKLKISLNKRVAFPLSKETTAANSSSAQPLNLPPPIPLLNQVETKEEEPTVSDNKEEKLFDPDIEKEKILLIFRESLLQLTPSVQTSVKAKLKNLEDEWAACDLELQKMLVQLAEYVENKDSKGAGSIQRKIVMQGYNKSFMHGIRPIVLNLESNDDDDKQQDSVET